MANILWSGSHGFVAGYGIQKLLDNGHTVVGVDNDSKYGPIEKSYEHHPRYTHYSGDVKNTELLINILMDHEIEVFVFGASLIGGIPYFVTYPFDIIDQNNAITGSSFRASIFAKKYGKLDHIINISSSMVFESTTFWPSSEGDQLNIAPPKSTYGFQKLATEYYCLGAWEQYRLPWKTVRPFNAVGRGEQKALVDTEVKSGNIELAMSHVIPDLVQKIHKQQYPLELLGEGNQIRYFTYAGDLAEGIYKTIFCDKAINEDFNLSIDVGHNILDLAKIIWKKMDQKLEFKYVSAKPFKYDVQKRVPNTEKAKKILGFEAKTSLEQSLDEVIPWIREMSDLGKI